MPNMQALLVSSPLCALHLEFSQPWFRAIVQINRNKSSLGCATRLTSHELQIHTTRSSLLPPNKNSPSFRFQKGLLNHAQPMISKNSSYADCSGDFLRVQRTCAKLRQHRPQTVLKHELAFAFSPFHRQKADVMENAKSSQPASPEAQRKLVWAQRSATQRHCAAELCIKTRTNGGKQETGCKRAARH